MQRRYHAPSLGEGNSSGEKKQRRLTNHESHGFDVVSRYFTIAQLQSFFFKYSLYSLNMFAFTFSFSFQLYVDLFAEGVNGLGQSTCGRQNFKMTPKFPASWYKCPV